MLRKLEAILRRLRACGEGPVLPRTSRTIDPERQKQLARLRDETLARVTFGQG